MLSSYAPLVPVPCSFRSSAVVDVPASSAVIVSSPVAVEAEQGSEPTAAAVAAGAVAAASLVVE